MTVSSRRVVRILICGDRNWRDEAAIDDLVSALIDVFGDDIVIIHGACRGVDTLAGSAAMRQGLTVWAEPAKWKKHGNYAGPIRNELMLERYKPHLVVAVHPDLDASSGTKNMLKLAEEKDIPTFIFRNLDDVKRAKQIWATPESASPVS